MRQNSFYVILILIFVPEKMVLLIGAFVFGYCFGYYMFEIFKYKNQKEEIHEFFLRYNRKHGLQRRKSFVEKLHEIKITDDVFFGEDLSFDKRFLEAVTENLVKDLGHCEVSHYLSKKSMAICCETFVLTKETGTILLDVVDKIIKEYFF